MMIERLCIGAAIVGATWAAPGRAGGDGAGVPRAEVPDTPAGRQLAAWAEAFNVGGREALRRYFGAHTAPGSLLAKMPERDRLASAMFLRGATGGVTLSGVESPSEHVAKAESSPARGGVARRAAATRRPGTCSGSPAPCATARCSTRGRPTGSSRSGLIATAAAGTATVSR